MLTYIINDQTEVYLLHKLKTETCNRQRTYLKRVNR